MLPRRGAAAAAAARAYHSKEMALPLLVFASQQRAGVLAPLPSRSAVGRGGPCPERSPPPRCIAVQARWEAPFYALRIQSSVGRYKFIQYQSGY